MTEAEFLDRADAMLTHIETAIDDAELDVDISLNGGVLEIEFDDGAKLIINRHAPNKELWLAAPSGGFHYRWLDGVWRNTRDQGEFLLQLGAVIQRHAGVVIDL